ncbi:MAG: hypothetical protein V1492_04095 [Candidatus Micrarchaeota archaeon]
MVSIIGIRLNEGNVKIKEDVPPKGVGIDLKINKIIKAEQPNAGLAKFTYMITYLPNTAVVKLDGEALFTDTPEIIDKLVKSWKEKQKIDEDAAIAIMNAVNPYVSYNAMFILRVFNLPPHIAPPPIVAKKK